jgi:sodium transport system permease protein
MLTGITPARMVRLCLKELRESLRDRRTIATLVLMPLLVYPLLSLVLNRILLTSNTSSTQNSVNIGICEEALAHDVTSVLALGYELLGDREVAPLFLEDIREDRSNKAAISATTATTALPYPELLSVKGDGLTELRNSAIDLVIVRNSGLPGVGADATFGDVESSSVNGSFVDGESGNRGSQLNTESRKLDAIDGDVKPVQMDADVLGNYEIIYRDGDPQSERALQLLERMFAAANNRTAELAMGAKYRTPFRLSATPLAMKSNYASLLATMVPLVLVLMTMAGAVYPAIDLTAGERERGTMESLIVSPTPSAIILLAKYSAVVIVALLTALANLGAMTVTLWVSGIGKIVFGDGALTLATMGTVLMLLILFTMFFAALLLAVTSFAKSFKEAQAYLIPLMLLALTPGVMSLLPGIKFTTVLATVPLVNIVLLAREVLSGTAQWDTGLVAVICNFVYALAALALAGRLFGSDASMHGSKGSWSDLFSRPVEQQDYPTVDQMALTMAAMFPLYFIASSLLPSLPASLGFADELSTNLWFSAAVSFLLILGTPILASWLRNIRFATTFRLAMPSTSDWLKLLPAILLVGASSWMFAHEIFMIGQQLGIGTIQLDKIERFSEFQEKLKQVPLWVVLTCLAITPAVCEEVLFRGFVLGSFSRFSKTGAILMSAMLFGLMHVLTSNVLAIERFLPTTFMGIILGWLCVQSGSLWPGMLLHAVHNGLLLSFGHFEDQLKEWKILVEEGEHLPSIWLACGAVALATGLSIVWYSGRGTRASSSDVVADPVKVEVGVE